MYEPACAFLHGDIWRDKANIKAEKNQSVKRCLLATWHCSYTDPSWLPCRRPSGLLSSCPLLHLHSHWSIRGTIRILREKNASLFLLPLDLIKNDRTGQNGIEERRPEPVQTLQTRYDLQGKEGYISHIWSGRQCRWRDRREGQDTVSDAETQP